MGRSPGAWTPKMKRSAQARTPQRPESRTWRGVGPILAVAALLGGGAMLSGCKKEPEKATVLAQVGNSTLTLEELRESFPAEFEQLIRREQYLDFIKRWMDDEVVYQQALKANLEKDSLVGRKLEKLRRKLLIEEFLARENATEMFEPDEMAMNQYYEMHKEEFRRKVPEVKFAQMRVQTNKQAMDLRAKAARTDFLAVAAANSMDPVPEAYSSIPFKKQTEFPPCLSQDIAATGIGAVTYPIACPDGFYLVKVIERQDAGSLVPFGEAKEEISGILIMERKDKLMDGKISKFKEGISVSYNLDQIPGLTDAPKPPEAGPAAAATAPVPSEPAAVKSPAPAAAAAKPSAPAPAAPPAAAPPAQEARLPREPASMGGAGSPAPVPGSPSAGSAATDPRMPREPWQTEAGKPKPAYRKRVPRPAAARAPDSSETRAAPRPSSETTPETAGQKPEAEENSNAQIPETP
jgi:parvulin-like peptidyl-prolyl isomerase